jgi:hypothetical protein
MAEPHHTAPRCLSGFPDNPFANLPTIRPEASNIDEKARSDIDAAVTGIDHIKRAINSLLTHSDTCGEAVASGASVPPSAWPLPASTYASLLVAIHFLDECNGMLRHELKK